MEVGGGGAFEEKHTLAVQKCLSRQGQTMFEYTGSNNCVGGNNTKSAMCLLGVNAGKYYDWMFMSRAIFVCDQKKLYFKSNYSVWFFCYCTELNTNKTTACQLYLCT